LVDGTAAFENLAFEGISDYASLEAGTYNVNVVPTGATEPVVIDANLDLAGGKDYSVVAVGMLDSIEPLVLEDNNAAPAAGKAHVRFVHASPDAPAVDIAVKDGPVLFSNVAFKAASEYVPVDAGTYDLDVRVAGSDTVALAVPGVALADGAVYTVFAMGLAGGEPALKAVPSVDAQHETSTMPEALPKTGAAQDTTLILMMALGVLAIIGGLSLSNRRSAIRVESAE
jgi:LPXTG-motif cell wall-anchored protein